MKNMILLSLIFSVGCASQPITKPVIDDSRTFNYGYDETWQAVVQAFAEESYPIKAIEKDSGFISTDWINLPGADYNMPPFSLYAMITDRSWLNIWEDGRFSFNAFVKKIDENSTNIKINMHIEAYERNVSKKWHPCWSKGYLEKKLLDSIEKQIEPKN